MAETTLERLDHHARLARGDGLHLHHSGLQKLCDGTLHARSPCRYDCRRLDERSEAPSGAGRFAQSKNNYFE
jgi:hypothetical protein